MSVVVVDRRETPLSSRLAARWSAGGTSLVDAHANRDSSGDAEGPVVIWGSGSSADIDGSGRAVVEPDEVRRWCESLDDRTVNHITLVSSALVFGPAPHLAVPLSEAAEPSDWPAGHPARRWRDIEETVRAHAEDRTCPLAILRPVVISSLVASRSPLGVASPWNPRVFPVDDTDPYRQFLHVDDLIGAVVWASDARLDGTFHIAPGGWLRASRQRDLSGNVLARRPTIVREDDADDGVDPVFRAYLETSLVVSPAAAESQGWTAQRNNEEAIIDSAAEGWWSSLSARRRQDASLAGLGVGVSAAVALGATVARRWLRSRPR